jgi:hypothetical protein
MGGGAAGKASLMEKPKSREEDIKWEGRLNM